MAPRYPPLTPLPDIIQPNNSINNIVQQLMELQPYHPHPTPHQLAIPGPSTAQMPPSNHTSRPLQAARALNYNTTTNFPIINFIKQRRNITKRRNFPFRNTFTASPDSTQNLTSLLSPELHNKEIVTLPHGPFRPLEATPLQDQQTPLFPLTQNVPTHLIEQMEGCTISTLTNPINSNRPTNSFYLPNNLETTNPPLNTPPSPIITTLFPAYANTALPIQHPTILKKRNVTASVTIDPSQSVRPKIKPNKTNPTPNKKQKFD